MEPCNWRTDDDGGNDGGGCMVLYDVILAVVNISSTTKK